MFGLKHHLTFHLSSECKDKQSFCSQQGCPNTGLSGAGLLVDIFLLNILLPSLDLGSVVMSQSLQVPKAELNSPTIDQIQSWQKACLEQEV